MNATINDVDALKKFRDDMLDTVDDLMKQYKKTEDAIENVARTWRDSQFRDFKVHFEEDKDKIKPLSEDIKEFEENVYDLEKILREYLGLANNM